MIHLRWSLALLLVGLAGCTALSTPAPTSAPPAPPTPTLLVKPTAGVTPTPVGPTKLEIWLPLEFAPLAGLPGSEILQARLEAFRAVRPDVSVQVRIKALDGAGGLLDALTTASAAAPLALPDLVALPRPMMETAALKGLLHPYNEFIDPPEDTDWFDYASRLERLQDSQFGVAFAGDALVLVYRTESIPEPPTDLASLLQAAGPLAFPAADPQALFTLALYQSTGGIILDDVGRPVLDKKALEKIFTFYHQAAQLELLPFWLTQFQSDEQAWQAFQDGQASMVITWASRYLQTLPVGTAAAPIPTALGEDFTLGTGWVWALSGEHADKQRAAAQLASFLSEGAFLGEWTLATGYLPPRPSALNKWQNVELRTLIRRVSLSTHLYPSADVLPALASPLVDATTNMLKLQGDPASAAQAAVDSLLKP